MDSRIITIDEFLKAIAGLQKIVRVPYLPIESEDDEKKLSSREKFDLISIIEPENNNIEGINFKEIFSHIKYDPHIVKHIQQSIDSNIKNIEIIKEYIIANKEDPELLEILKNNNLLFKAITEGFTSIAEVIIDNVPAVTNMISKSTGMTPLTTALSLLLAPSKNNYIIDKLLLVVDVNQVDGNGQTALYCALARANLKYVNELINNHKAALSVPGFMSSEQLFGHIYQWIMECYRNYVEPPMRNTNNDMYYCYQQIVPKLRELRQAEKAAEKSARKSVKNKVMKSFNKLTMDVAKVEAAVLELQTIKPSYSLDMIKEILKQNTQRITLIIKYLNANNYDDSYTKILDLLSKKTFDFTQSSLRTRAALLEAFPQGELPDVLQEVLTKFSNQQQQLSDLLQEGRVKKFINDCEENRSNVLLTLERFNIPNDPLNSMEAKLTPIPEDKQEFEVPFIQTTNTIVELSTSSDGNNNSPTKSKEGSVNYHGTPEMLSRNNSISNYQGTPILVTPIKHSQQRVELSDSDDSNKKPSPTKSMLSNENTNVEKKPVKRTLDFSDRLDPSSDSSLHTPSDLEDKKPASESPQNSADEQDRSRSRSRRDSTSTSEEDSPLLPQIEMMQPLNRSEKHPFFKPKPNAANDDSLSPSTPQQFTKKREGKK